MAKSNESPTKTRLLSLVECALMVALAVVIDLIPMPKWPNGNGS